MCQKCVEAGRRLFAGISDQDLSSLLWNCTSFPFGSPEQVEGQLAEIAARRTSGPIGADWMGIEQERVEVDMDKQMELFHLRSQES